MGKRILIVDDAVFMRMLLRDILVVNGFEVAGEAENGHEAVSLYKRIGPDLVLMDITMPEMGGIKALREILAFDPEARIVMVSAMGQQEMVVQSIKSGAIDFVVKPFKTNRVIDAVNRAVYAAAAS
jgi:two-component system chemotaxis response regulator CheY